MVEIQQQTAFRFLSGWFHLSNKLLVFTILTAGSIKFDDMRMVDLFQKVELWQEISQLTLGSIFCRKWPNTQFWLGKHHSRVLGVKSEICDLPSLPGLARGWKTPYFPTGEKFPISGVLQPFTSEPSECDCCCSGLAAASSRHCSALVLMTAEQGGQARIRSRVCNVLKMPSNYYRPFLVF